VQPSAELTSQVLPKAPKIPNTKGHVAVVKNISNVMVNNAREPSKYKGLRAFLCIGKNSIFYKKHGLDTILHTIFLRIICI